MNNALNLSKRDREQEQTSSRDNRFKQNTIIKIREARKNDIMSIAQINVYGWKFACKNFIDETFLNALSVEEKAEKLLKNFSNDKIIVAELNNRVVGFLRYDFESDLQQKTNTDGEVKTMYVDTAFLRQNIGTALLNNAKEIFVKNNKHSFALWCFDKAKIAKSFYLKMGGEIAFKESRKIGEKNYMDLCFVFNF